MITTWIIITVIGGVVYLYLVMRIVRGLKKSGRMKDSGNSAAAAGDDKSQMTVSVVIAARNEEFDIGDAIRSVLNQDYPAENLELVIVNDRSTDKTAHIISIFCENDPRIHLLHIDSVSAGVSPKKQALQKGIESATGEIIVTTDADCRHSAKWLRSLVSYFSSEVGMVTGQARFDIGESPPLWQRLQSLDFQSQGLAAAGLIADGMPFSCTGASLAFRKSLFDEIDGYEGVNNLISGDDELLLAKTDLSGWDICAAVGSEVVVSTRPPHNLNELWQQRSRWGSKGLYYRFSRKIVLGWVFLFFLSLSLGPLFAAISGHWQIWIYAAIFKLIIDTISMSIGVKLFDESFRWRDFFILELIHAPSLVFFSLSGHFLSFEWKGQRFRSHSR